jgi:hypothetical protein
VLMSGSTQTDSILCGVPPLSCRRRHTDSMQGVGHGIRTAGRYSNS